MGSPEDLVSHHVTVLRRCGLSDDDICEVYGVSDPPDDVSVGRVVMESLEGEPTPRNLYDQTHRVLATAPRGIDAPRDYPNRVVPQQLNTVMGAFGFSMYFLDGNGDPLASGAEPSQPFRIALEDPNGNVRTTTFEYPDTALDEHNYPALVAAIQSDLLDGVPLSFAMLSDWADDRWRFVLFEADRLDALEKHYGDGIECFGEPLLHEHTPVEFASGQAVSEPAAETASGTGTSDAGDESDGDIGVDESTEGWLGSGGSDLSDVDLEGSSSEEPEETAETEAAVETGLEDIFSTIEEDATAGGDGGVEIESTGKSVEDLMRGTTEPTEEEPAVDGEPAAVAEEASEPAGAETATTDAAAEAEPTTETESAAPEPSTTEAAAPEATESAPPEPTESAAPDATESASPEAVETDTPEAATESAAEPEPQTTAEPTADAAETETSDAVDDDGFIMADPEPARTEAEEPSAADAAAESDDQPAGEPATGTEPSAETADATPAERDAEATEESTSEPADATSEPADATSEPADATSEPADATSVTAESTSEQVTEAATSGSTGTAETTASTTDSPAATAESTPSEPPEPTPTEATTADGSAATEAEESTDDSAASEDSPGFVGRLVAAVKGIF
ncbi:hypothetical protein [Haloarchaeobius baliensis]|uniref:hypothetical protein n=1 Tax=Haloarchaeobius baliensis TaxID=1670458 RepID=UPI003F883899